MSDRRLYLAYGSNINLDQMAYRCPDAVPIKPVVLHGYELTFRGGGVATVVPKRDAVVLGLMWSITPACERSLDRYEGYPSFYHKTDVAVTDHETGRIHYAMMYEMDERYKEPAVPSPFYYEGIREGYIQNGMDTAPLYEALRNVEREVYERDRIPTLFDVPRKPLRVKKRTKRSERER